MHFSEKKSGRLSSAGPEILAFGSHCSAKFQPIFDFFIPNFKLRYENLENKKKTNRLDTVVFNLRQIKQRNLGHPVILIAFAYWKLLNIKVSALTVGKQCLIVLK